MSTAEQVVFFICFVLQGCCAAWVLVRLENQGVHLPFLSLLFSTTVIFSVSSQILWHGSMVGSLVSLVVIILLSVLLFYLGKKINFKPENWVIGMSGVYAILALMAAVSLI